MRYIPRLLAFDEPPRGRYAPFYPAGLPEAGGTGMMNDKEPRYTIHTLNMCVSTADQMYRKPSAVWVYAGHGYLDGQGNSYLQFRDPTRNSGIYRYQTDPSPDVQKFKIDGKNLDHIRLAYLMACVSAGANSTCWGNPLVIPEANSIARAFQGAGVRAVVGFKNVLYLEDKPYQRFHDIFWTEICKGATVGKAFDDAKSVSDRTKPFPGNEKLAPRLFGQPGYRNIKIVPPKYGFE